MTPDPAEVAYAIQILAACDHFDISRATARALPADMPILEILKAADGATRLARALNTNRRTAA